MTFLLRLTALALTLCVSCQKKSAPPENIVRILANSSLLGKNSLGEFLAQNFSSDPSISTQYSESADQSSLLGELRRHPKKFDLVWGLDDSSYHQALREQLIEPGSIYDQGILGFVVDTEKLSDPSLQGLLPLAGPNPGKKSWADIARLSRATITQDPRLSTVGFALLRGVFEKNLLSLAQLRSLTKRSFPSWSSSYKAFLANEAPLIWTYQSSVAFHRCQENSQRYIFLEMSEGHPLQQEWIAPVRGRPAVSTILSFVVGSEFQSQVPLKNWMYPVREDVKLPDCFPPPVQNTWPVINHSKQDTAHWLDQWAAQ